MASSFDSAAFFFFGSDGPSFDEPAFDTPVFDPPAFDAPDLGAAVFDPFLVLFAAFEAGAASSGLVLALFFVPGFRKSFSPSGFFVEMTLPVNEATESLKR